MALKAIGKFLNLNTAEGSSQVGAQCAKGHVLDPTWEGFCPFCDAENRVHEKSPPLPNVQAAAGDDHGGRRTRVGDAAPVGGRTTRVDDGTGPAVRPPDTRRITGVLMTYSWSQSGQMFPVREGKNRIGAGAVSDEGHRDCEILVREDATMSTEHALILCRHGRYELVDLNSSNGTFLNGEMVSTQAMPLEMGAKIKAGNTVFEFLKFQLDPSATVASAASSTSAASARPAERQQPPVRDRGETDVR